MTGDTPFGASGLLAYRPVLWWLMLAAAVALLVNPWFVSLFLVGMAIGLAARIRRGQRRARP
jgi:hypothetical protein